MNMDVDVETNVFNGSSRKGKKAPTVPGFSKEVIRYLRPNCNEKTFSPGDIIIHRGEPGTAFYVVITGEIEVRLTGEDGRCLKLARMGPNTGFGEMALLRKERTSADIIALTAVTVLECPAKQFRRALAQNEPFRDELMARMARDLQKTSAEAWAFHQRAEAFNMLVHQETRHTEPLVAKSNKMRKTEKEICDLSGKPDPVLITGEPGTGKLFAARKIHNLSTSDSIDSAPLIVVDCLRLGETEAGMVLFGSSQLDNSDGKPEGFGALHLAHGGTLVLRHIEALVPEAQKFLSCYLDLLDFSGEAMFPLVRIIGTSSEDPARAVKDHRLITELSDQLTAHTLHIPPLKDRKADIVPLARIFLKDGSGSDRFSENAEHALLSQRFRHNNVKELREAVELASLFCGDGPILSEHIFAGPKDKDIPAEYDLGEMPVIRGIIQGKGRLLGFLRGGVLAVFAAIILLCLSAAGYPTGQIANTMIWAVWEPVLIFLFLFLGHVWCIVCPLSTAAMLIQRIGSLNRPTGMWVKKYSAGFVVGGFFLIVWSERVFHMTERPFASGLLLLALMTGAMLFALVYQRETWCRYVCPLGALAAGYSLPAALHVRAKPHICATYCTTHECYKGTAETSGCPVFHHPLYISDGHNCKLCFKCLKLCPHGSARLYLRPFLQPVWFFGGFARMLTPFALAVFCLSIVLLASNRSDWIRGPVELTSVALFAVFFGVLFNNLLPRLLSAGAGDRERDNTTASHAAFALMILGWGPLMAYQLSNIQGLAGVRFYAVPGSLFYKFFAGGEVTLLLLLQLSVILLALLLAAIAFWRIRVQAEKEGTGINAAGWNGLLLFSLLYVLFAIFSLTVQ
ncbi:MAG: cyclic nucleotide-binding domain-containing protein [bacterium]|nr:cyclic nucleotide-binding domain-containing protein [bacterium]